MTAAHKISLRWALCFGLALGIHAAGAAALLGYWTEDTDEVADAPVVMIELAPLSVAPDVTPTELPPGPQQADAEPQPDPDPVKLVEKAELLPAPPHPAPVTPVEKLTLPPLPHPELAMPPSHKQVEKLKEKEKKPRQRHASLANAPSPADTKARRAAAPAPGASAHHPNAVPNWKSQLVARLERYKRYPSEAQSRGDHGVAQLAFSVDRRGGVHHARIARSSGSSLLDRATLALVERASPLPAPPPEIRGAQIAIVVPIRFDIQ